MQRNSKLDALEIELKAVTHELDNLVNAIAQGLAIGTIKERVMAFESKKLDLQKEIDIERMKMPIKLSFDEYVFFFEKFKNGDVND